MMHIKMVLNVLYQPVLLPIRFCKRLALVSLRSVIVPSCGTAHRERAAVTAWGSPRQAVEPV